MKNLSFFFSALDNNKAYLLKLHHRCNYHCAICGESGNNPRQYLRSLNDVKKEIREAKRFGHKNIDFGGTEPTLHPQLLEMIEYVNKLGMRPAILTNGSQFSSSHYTKRFRNLQPLAIKINFHSHSQKLFDEMSGRKDSYKRTLKAIENINRELDIFPSNPSNFLSASITITSRNFRDLDKTVNFLYGLGVRIIQFSPVSLAGNVYNHPNLLIATREILSPLNKALKIARIRNMHYYLCNFPICLVESEIQHIIPKPTRKSEGFFKVAFCDECPYNNRCCGISKGALIARYGRQLLQQKFLFSKLFFSEFLTENDLDLIRSLKN